MAATAGQVPTPGCSRCSFCPLLLLPHCTYVCIQASLEARAWVLLGSLFGFLHLSRHFPFRQLWLRFQAVVSDADASVDANVCFGRVIRSLNDIGGRATALPCPLQLSLDRLSSHMRVYFVINACRLPPPVAPQHLSRTWLEKGSGLGWGQLILFVVNDVDSICCEWGGEGDEEGQGHFTGQ